MANNSFVIPMHVSVIKIAPDTRFRFHELIE
jgi:hypothetical protein